MPQANSDGPLDRAFAIVGHVAGQVRAVSVAEIANALALPLPTAHRLIGNLEQRGLLQKAAGTKRYVVGNQLVTLSAKVIGAAFRTARRHGCCAQSRPKSASNARSASCATMSLPMSTVFASRNRRVSNSIRAKRRRSTALRPARST